MDYEFIMNADHISDTLDDVVSASLIRVNCFQFIKY